MTCKSSETLAIIDLPLHTVTMNLFKLTNHLLISHSVTKYKIEFRQNNVGMSGSGEKFLQCVRHMNIFFKIYMEREPHHHHNHHHLPLILKGITHAHTHNQRYNNWSMYVHVCIHQFMSVFVINLCINENVTTKNMLVSNQLFFINKILL